MFLGSSRLDEVDPEEAKVGRGEDRHRIAEAGSDLREHVRLTFVEHVQHVLEGDAVRRVALPEISERILARPLRHFVRHVQTPLRVGERRFQIGQQIGDILDTHADADQIGRDLEGAARRRCMRHATGVLDQ